MTKTRRSKEVTSRPTTVLRCKACNGFMGYVNRACVAFCSDICRLTREWTFPDDDLLELITFLKDQYGMVPRVIAAKINKSGLYPNDLDYRTVSAMYYHHKRRKRYAA